VTCCPENGNISESNQIQDHPSVLKIMHSLGNTSFIAEVIALRWSSKINKGVIALTVLLNKKK